jgi:LysM domain
MSAATAGEPGRRAGATAGQWSLVAAPAQENGPAVSRQRGARAVPGRRVAAAAPRQRTGSAAPGRRGQQQRAAMPGRRAASGSVQRPMTADEQRPGSAQQRRSVAPEGPVRDQPQGPVRDQGARTASSREPRTAPVREPRTVPGQRAGATPGLRITPVAGHLAVVAPRQRAGAAEGQPGMAMPEQRDNTADRRGRPGTTRPHPPALAVVPPQSAAPDERPEAPAPGRKAGAGVDEWQQRAAHGAPRRPAQAQMARARPRARLTRRGRIVMSALVIAAMLLVAVLAWIGGATRAEAAGSGSPPSAVYRNLASVIVQPGESLWTIATQAEPTADPRSVIQQIIDLNALGAASIQPGQRLWVPRS